MLQALKQLNEAYTAHFDIEQVSKTQFVLWENRSDGTRKRQLTTGMNYTSMTLYLSGMIFASQFKRML